MVRTKGMKKEKKGRTKRIQNKRIRRTSMKRRSKVSNRIKRSKRSKKSRVKGYKRKRLSGKQYGGVRVTVNSGKGEKVGVEFSNTTPPTVKYVHSGGIAERKGIEKGDYLVTVNSRDVSNMNLNQARKFYNMNKENNLVFEKGDSEITMTIPPGSWD